MNSQESRAYLNSFINYEFKTGPVDPKVFRLDRVRCLLEVMGSPHRGVTFIHVAGTKGKGSTCALTSSILAAAGHKVGLYTSPHLYNYTERIRILDKNSLEKSPDPAFAGQITEDDLNGILNDALPAIERIKSQESELGRLSFFEIYTVLAILYFKRCKTDIVVLEVGMGGRLDATNAVETQVCGITPVSLEHTQYLGTTVAQIAGEKAAIIKDKKQRAVIGPQLPEAEDVIRDQCLKVGNKAAWVGRDISWEFLKLCGNAGQEFNVRTQQFEYKKLQMPLLGGHQLSNAAMAIGLVECAGQLGFSVSPDQIRAGIKLVCWPGRFEVLARNPLVVLDGAHHAPSMQALIKTMKEIFPDKKVTVILGCSQDKDVAGICAEVNRIAETVILTKADHPRSLDFRKFNLNGFFSGKKVVTTDNAREALVEAHVQSGRDDVVLVTGSIFLVGEARKLCIR